MHRRAFVGLAGVALAALVARTASAQKPGKAATLGILLPSPIPNSETLATRSWMIKLKELGWIDGQTLNLQWASAAGREERLPELAADLTRKRPDIIWAIGPEAAVAAARATKTIPVVFWGAGFPVETGLVDSVARPGRNITGVAYFTAAEYTKQLEFLHHVVPSAKRVGWISVATTIQTVSGGEYTEVYAHLDAAARKLGIELRRSIVRRQEDFDAAFARMLEARVQGFGAAATTLTWREAARLIEFANRNRLPSAFGSKEFVEAGGLVSYGPDVWATAAQCIVYVDRILRGARPADLPVELPSKQELAVNLKTARALGITVPQSVLLRADRVIE